MSLEKCVTKKKQQKTKQKNKNKTVFAETTTNYYSSSLANYKKLTTNNVPQIYKNHLKS